MQKILSASQMRDIDRLTTERYATPSLLLMEAAANAAARIIAKYTGDNFSTLNAQILCGPGNNGGDGAALARALWMMGCRVDVLLFGNVSSTKGDARVNFELLRHIASFEAGSNERPSRISFVECEEISSWETIASSRRRYDVVVDALFGTGLKRPLQGVTSKVVAHLALIRSSRERSKDKRPLIVSLDLPSGLDADSSNLIGDAVCSDITVTFTAPKMANVLPPASHLNGVLVVADIGSPPALINAAPSKFFLVEEDDARTWLKQTRYEPGSYKKKHGHVLVIAGSRGMTGAAALCANAAMSSGAGLVTVATAQSALDGVTTRLMPEVMTAGLPETELGSINSNAVDHVIKLAERATVIAIGCGLSNESEETRKFVREVVERRTRPMVIDADAINALAPWPASLRGTTEKPIIVTPHEGEMLRLLGTGDRTALQDREKTAAEFAAQHQLTVVLKGARTIVAASDGRVFVNPTGNPGLGTAGSGDTLTGIIAGFNAQSFASSSNHLDAVSSTVAALYIGGLAGDLAARENGMRTLVASDIRKYLGDAIRSLDPVGEQP